jgi:ribosomal protein S18 acetylase RimI-like enzyme
MSSVVFSSETRARIDNQRARQMRGREELISKYGSISDFLSDTVLEIVNDEASTSLKSFYALYQRMFALEEEREPLSGFQTVLGFNRNPQVQGLFGPLQEAVMLLRARRSDNVIAAVNYIVMMYPAPQRPLLGFDGSCQINFLCVDPDFRGTGLGQHMLDCVDREARRLVASKTGAIDPDMFFTIEQNNPARMTPEQIETDAAVALVDPFERMNWWAKRGYRRLEFKYEQPPLSPNQRPCDFIDYFVRFPSDPGCATQKLAAGALFEHLRRFFFVSVGKFEIDLKHNPQWAQQKNYLESRLAICIASAGAGS